MAPTLKALKVAADENPHLVCEVFYNKFSDGIDIARATSELADMSRTNMRVAPVQRPRLHAKVLGWDNHNLLVTSQNLLSSDPSGDNLRAEIGVEIRHNNLVRTFRERLMVAKDFSNQ